MNLLEHYIKEVISIEQCKEEWVLQYIDMEFFKVKFVCECYGVVETKTRVWEKQEMEEYFNRGFFFA